MGTLIILILLLLLLLRRTPDGDDNPPPDQPTLELGPPIFGQIGANGQATLNLTYLLFPEVADDKKVWAMESGPAGGSVQFTNTGAMSVRFVFNQSGNYFVRLTVTLPSSQVLTDVIQCQVDPAQVVTPTINLGADTSVEINPVSGRAILILNYTANGPIAAGSKVWTVLAGPAAVIRTDTGPTQARLEFSMAGNYTVELTATVTTSSGAGSASDTVNVQVLGAGEPPPDDIPNPPAGARLITGNQPNGFTVPAGQHWLINSHVTTPGSVIVFGTLWMRPGAWLEFTNVDNSKFQGGVFNPETDIGLWVEGNGEINFWGTPKLAWGYGVTNHPTWRPGDEIVECPMTPSEVTSAGFKRYTPGSALRTMPNGQGLPVLNLTRDVKMTGQPGHNMHYRNVSTRVPTLKWTEIAHAGVDGVLGRYPVHYHIMGDASRGTITEGVVVKHSGKHAFVAHKSNGVTFKNCIGYDIESETYWFDPALGSDDPMVKDLAYIDCVSAWCHDIGSFRNTGWFLERVGIVSRESSLEGHGLVQGCLDVGGISKGGVDDFGGGYHWDEGASNRERPSFWEFNDNVTLAHNHWGISTWQNSGPTHHTIASSGKYTSINCRSGGIMHGAYTNAYNYRNCEIYNLPGGIGVRGFASSRLPLAPFTRPDGYGLVYENFKVRGGAHGIELTHHIASPSTPTLYKNFDIQGTSGKKLLWFETIGGGSQPNNTDIVNCGITPADVELKGPAPGSVLRIQQGSQAWRMLPSGATTSIPLFYPSQLI